MMMCGHDVRHSDAVAAGQVVDERQQMEVVRDKP